ncbi:MAG: pyruvate dehydrogenase (acetyl-transferring) E1 component subunit alpha [Deltaproteobacteria bacterium]|nr:pyruvate dehydrogenase (acetyl-transferring) E1 component subunit alpha [Deltaproteobacteria bacterium]
MKMLYEKMLLCRRFEEKAAVAYGTGKIGGFCHLYIGQEAVAAGALCMLRKTDYAIAAYREHAHAILKGIDPKYVMAELYGKVTGSSRGKGGSMHIFDMDCRFLGGHGIVGGQIPIAAGAGFSIKYRKTDDVVVCFFGEGAIHQGVFHESMNLAALWHLPVIFICENNRYGMGTSLERASSIYDLSKKALAYEMERGVVDGMDAVNVWERVSEAVDYARHTKKPTLLEARTYRFRGHSMSDPATYRTKDELNEMKSRDPISLQKELLVAQKLVDEAWFEEVDKKVKAEMEVVMRFAEESPDPDLAELHDHVLVEPEEQSQREGAKSDG